MPKDWTPDQLYVHFVAIFRSQEQLAVARQEQSIERTRSLEVSFREHVDAAAKELKIAFDAAQLAILKAEASQNKRNDETNRFSAVLTDRVAQFPTREFVDARFDDFSERLDVFKADITNRLYAESDGKTREIQAMKLALADRVTTDSFDAYVDKQEDLKVSGRRASAQAAISVGIALITLIGGIIFTVVSHGHP